jgi:hypothetical protein
LRCGCGFPRGFEAVVAVYGAVDFGGRKYEPILRWRSQVAEEHQISPAIAVDPLFAEGQEVKLVCVLVEENAT